MLLLIFIFACINQNVYSLPPINFTDAVLTNRMIEALNSALRSRYEQPIALAPSPSPSLRHQVRQHSINQQQYVEPMPQPPTFSHVKNYLPEQQQQQFYYNQVNDYQQQPQYPNPISDQEHAFYQQQFIEHQQRQQQYQQQQQQQQQQQPQQQSSQTNQHYVPSEPQQQTAHANQQYYPVEPQQHQQPQQPQQSQQQYPQVVPENFVPEHSLPAQPQTQQQQQQSNEADSRGYYNPFQGVSWFNFPSIWPAITTNQINPTAALPIVPTQAAAPSADGCPLGLCPTGASCNRDGGQWLCGCGFSGCPGIQNPCGIYGRYYFPYYPDASRFIQCDQTGVFWIRKCAPGTIFDPKIGVCNYPPVVVETGRK